MLIEFTFRNYRSFRKQTTFSLQAAASKEHLDSHSFPEDANGKRRVLKSAAVYGPNASGKTNLVHALGAMRDIVLNSAQASQRGEPIKAITPFLLDNHSMDDPTLFEVVFVQEGIRYQYGFEATQNSVLDEWLFVFPRGRPQKWFERKETNRFEFGEHLSGPKRVVQDATRPNALFLSTAIQLNNEALSPIFDWFAKKLLYLGKQDLSPVFTLQSWSDETRKAQILELLKKADLGIEDMEVESRELLSDELPEELRRVLGEKKLKSLKSLSAFTASVLHRGPDGKFPLQLDQESEGTRRFLELAGPILDVLRNGKIFVIDELETSLHPLLAREIVNMFNSSVSNPENAQLIFTTHSVSLLDQKLFRRDQIWFTEKDEDNCSRAYPLTEFRPRKGTESLERGYMGGRYGALPLVRFN